MGEDYPHQTRMVFQVYFWLLAFNGPWWAVECNPTPATGEWRLSFLTSANARAAFIPRNASLEGVRGARARSSYDRQMFNGLVFALC